VEPGTPSGQERVNKRGETVSITGQVQRAPAQE